jgi:uncharacterized protein YigA (DUF484 family)
MITLPDLWTKIGEIQDLDALRLIHRLVQSEMTTVEAQLAQLQQVNRVIEEKMKDMVADRQQNRQEQQKSEER